MRHALFTAGSPTKFAKSNSAPSKVKKTGGSAPKYHQAAVKTQKNATEMVKPPCLPASFHSTACKKRKKERKKGEREKLPPHVHNLLFLVLLAQLFFFDSFCFTHPRLRPSSPGRVINEGKKMYLGRRLATNCSNPYFLRRQRTCCTLMIWQYFNRQYLRRKEAPLSTMWCCSFII